MDVSTLVFPLPSGIYQISQVPPGGIAKMDAWTAHIASSAIRLAGRVLQREDVMGAEWRDCCRA